MATYLPSSESTFPTIAVYEGFEAPPARPGLPRLMFAPITIMELATLLMKEMILGMKLIPPSLALILGEARRGGGYEVRHGNNRSNRPTSKKH